MNARYENLTMKPETTMTTRKTRIIETTRNIRSEKETPSRARPNVVLSAPLARQQEQEKKAIPVAHHQRRQITLSTKAKNTINEGKQHHQRRQITPSTKAIRLDIHETCVEVQQSVPSHKWA
jgi:hypothetical protein